MTQLNQIYKCGICGNVVEVVHAGVGELVCCGQPMNLLQENTTDAATENASMASATAIIPISNVLTLLLS